MLRLADPCRAVYSGDVAQELNTPGSPVQQTDQQQPLDPKAPKMWSQDEQAWAWYQYHADQRLRSFNFFIIFLGAGLVALSTALDKGHYKFAVLVAVLAGCLALAFLFLDKRNHDLVMISEQHFSEGSAMQKMVKARHDRVPKKDVEVERRGRMITHRLIFQLVMGVTAGAYGFAAAWILIAHVL